MSYILIVWLYSTQSVVDRYPSLIACEGAGSLWDVNSNNGRIPEHPYHVCVPAAQGAVK